MATRLTRRGFVTGGLGLVLLQTTGRAMASGACIDAPAPLAPKPQRAVSLRQACEALTSCAPTDRKCQALLQLNGMTRLDGFVVDQKNKDLVLWGGVEPGAPPLEFQDFVVALRSTHGRYAEMRDGLRYILQPAISIDPNPEVWAALDALSLDTRAPTRKHDEICAQSQTVRVEGMPRSTRIAKVLVEADYRMKKVAQGLVKLPIRPTIASPVVELWQSQRQAAMAGRTPPPGHKARFWFEPGAFSYKVSYSGDTAYLDTAQVVLRDQVQSLSEGKLVDSAATTVDPFNRAFACAWSDRMEDVYRAEPIWQDMRNIFRHFAVARILADKQILRQVGYDFGFLLDRYTVDDFSTPSDLPGLGRVEKYGYTRGGRHYTGWNAICGGVSIAFNRDMQEHHDDGMSQGAGSKVLGARPDITAVSWEVTGSVLPIARDMVIDRPKLVVTATDTEHPVLESIADILKRHEAPATAPVPSDSITDILKHFDKP